MGHDIRTLERCEKVFFIQRQRWCTIEHLQQKDGLCGTDIKSNTMPIFISPGTTLQAHVLYAPADATFLNKIAAADFEPNSTITSALN